MAKRRKFSEREVVSIVARQLGVSKDESEQPVIVCTICEHPIWPEEIPEIERDHGRPLGLMGDDSPGQCSFVHSLCHRLKTKDDIRRIAKAKRQAGEAGQQARRKRRDKPLMQSRKPQKPSDVGRKYDWKAGRFTDA